MVHEVPDQRRLLGEIHTCLKPGGKLLVAEPKIHVPGKAFHKTVATAEEAGFRVTEEPRVRWPHPVCFAAGLPPTVRLPP
jgi:SAM-dependent methyltransferase